MVENDVHSHEMNTHISGLIKVVLFNMEQVKFWDERKNILLSKLLPSLIFMN